jgi:F-type H+-transporting ATPase subunit epsilon
MKLKVLVPSQILVDETITKIIAEAENGSFCLKPRHVDFVTSLVPGLLSFTPEHGEQVFMAIDQGTLVKCGMEVLVSTRNAVRGTDLESLKRTVAEQYQNIDDAERLARSALARLEAGVLRRYTQMRDTST